jgi:hypothetical protein
MKLKRFTSAALSLLIMLSVFLGFPLNTVQAAGSWDYGYSGGVQTFTAPSAGKYQLEVWGAQGGNGLNTTGGAGGYSSGEVNLTAGQTINIYIGGSGYTTGGGWNGGGSGGYDSGSGQNAGGGGGATDIRTGYDLSTRVIVAGGGAGGGRDGATGVGGGASGTASSANMSGYPGQPGTQSGGGSPYTTGRGASYGYLGQGGNGSSGYNAAGGGGGGGGYYGGGGGTSVQDHGSGWSAGGGGGSGYVGGVSNGSMQSGVRTGSGYARITSLYTPPAVSGFNSYAYSNYTRSDWSISNSDASTKIEIYRNNGLAYSGTSSPFDDTGAVDTGAPNPISNLNASSSNRYPQIWWTGSTGITEQRMCIRHELFLLVAQVDLLQIDG